MNPRLRPYVPYLLGTILVIIVVVAIIIKYNTNQSPPPGTLLIKTGEILKFPNEEFPDLSEYTMQLLPNGSLILKENDKKTKSAPVVVKSTPAIFKDNKKIASAIYYDTVKYTSMYGGSGSTESDNDRIYQFFITIKDSSDLVMMKTNNSNSPVDWDELSIERGINPTTGHLGISGGHSAFFEWILPNGKKISMDLGLL